MLRVLTPICLVLTLWLSAGAAQADDDAGHDIDHDQAEEAYEGARQGAFLSLSDVIKRASPKIDGEIVKAKFEKVGGIPAYEIYFLDKQGRRQEIYLDARTAKPITRAGDDDE